MMVTKTIPQHPFRSILVAVARLPFQKLTPTVTDNTDQGRFEVWVDGRLAGVSEYTPAGESLIVAHTEIDEEYEGQGLASVLVREMLEAIRESGKPVIPLCQFTAEFIRSNPEFIDAVLPTLQAQFRPRP